MTQKLKNVANEDHEAISLLMHIKRLDEGIKKTSATLKEAKAERDNLIWQAQQKNITHAGNYELVETVKINRIIDMAAVRTIVKDDELWELCHPTLKDLSKILTENQIDKVTIKTLTTSYKVREIGKHGEEKA